MIISNIVNKKEMRAVQSETLSVLRGALSNTFGPMGSNTVISKEGMLTKYTKDGHSVLKDIAFQYTIEKSVKSDLEDITTHIVKKIGDGTTSAIILSSIIFEKLKELESEHTPYELVRDFKIAVKRIMEEIKSNARPFDSDRAFDITMISTNGNEEVSANIKNIYETYGLDVFVDVSISNTDESYLKSYDGMTLQTGYSDTAYINDSKKGVSSLRNPRVYMFEDPVDTPEMFSLFDTIIENNIMNAYRQDSEVAPIPTVILAPTVSRDMSSYMDKLINFMYQFKDESTKPPFLLITNIYQKEQITDISRICGCKPIKKYINPKQQQVDIKNGLAPTLENVVEFFGQADIVEADTLKTKFVNPMLMHDAEGNLSNTFNTLLAFLEVELKRAIEGGEDNNVTGTLKRRINSLKANMVEYLVGGVSMSDRDSVRDLVEDSVLNCRSASKNGVGFGANFEGLIASYKLKDTNKMHSIIHEAYIELALALYSTCFSTDCMSRVTRSIEAGMPVNLHTDKCDNKVVCSIDTDIVVLDAIAQIISLMFTSNQFLCPTPVHNNYLISE